MPNIKNKSSATMIVHVSPTYLLEPYTYCVDLIDVVIPELDMVLKQNEDLALRRPHPNKNYLVACRKVGLKAIDGFLIKTNRRLDFFKVITRWKIDGKKIVTHIAEMTVSDNEYDLVTDNMMLWSRFASDESDTEDRTPYSMMKYSPLEAQVVMQSVATNNNVAGVGINSIDKVVKGTIVERIQRINAPTVRSARLSTEFAIHSRIPQLQMAFVAGGSNG